MQKLNVTHDRDEQWYVESVLLLKTLLDLRKTPFAVTTKSIISYHNNNPALMLSPHVCACVTEDC